MESVYQSPVATGNLVWIANPSSGSVAFIDATSFAVQTVEAGDSPTYLAAVPDPTDDVAIVQNALSQNATLLRDHQGTLVATTFPSTADANSWAVSPKGTWALAWTNATLISNADPTQGFQDIAVLDLSGVHAPVILSVGYRPSQVAFASDESRAFAVTQDGISVIQLSGAGAPLVTQNFPLVALGPAYTTVQPEAGPPDGSTDAHSVLSMLTGDAQVVDAAASANPDVSFMPDGSFALVRIDGAAGIGVVSLTDGTTTSVALPALPTDLTMSPHGDFAVVALRDASAVAILPLPGIFTNPTTYTVVTIPGEIIGRAIVTPDAASALLFTTAATVPRLTVLTLATQQSRTILLHDAISAVFPSPDGHNAIVLHLVTPTPGSGIEGAFSIVPVAQSLPAKIVGVPAPPTSVAISPDSTRALISIRDDSTSTYGLQMALMPSLEVQPFSLASPPIAVGIVAGAFRGYAAQDYPEGRISFFDLTASSCDDAGSCNGERTITGFDLASRVVTGGSQ
jgi:hypothetical protein